jgi:hypothetical protein
VSDAARWFEDAPAFETEPLQRSIHPADDERRGVMGI